jgi:hypothetical protein
MLHPRLAGCVPAEGGASLLCPKRLSLPMTAQVR